MKKVNLPLIVILLFMFALASTTLAFQNEPEGFGGLKWGDSPGEDMILLGKGGIYPDSLWYNRYERKNDKLQIGGAKLKSIECQFYKGQFMGVWIRTEASNYTPLEDVVKLNFGTGYSRDYSSGDLFGIHYQIRLYQWSGNLATVILKLRIESDKFGSLNWGYLTIRSTKIYNQYQEDIRRKKEEEARRKEEERQKAAEEGLADFDYIPETKEEKKESNLNEKLKAEKSKKVILNSEAASDYAMPIEGYQQAKWGMNPQEVEQIFLDKSFIELKDPGPQVFGEETKRKTEASLTYAFGFEDEIANSQVRISFHFFENQLYKARIGPGLFSSLTEEVLMTALIEKYGNPTDTDRKGNPIWTDEGNHLIILDGNKIEYLDVNRMDEIIKIIKMEDERKRKETQKEAKEKV